MMPLDVLSQLLRDNNALRSLVTVHMDRIMPYIRKGIKDLITKVKNGKTKTISTSVYSIKTFERNVRVLSDLGEDQMLFVMVAKVIERLSERTPRQQALKELTALSNELEQYEPFPRIDVIKDLEQRVAALERHLVEIKIAGQTLSPVTSSGGRSSK